MTPLTALPTVKVAVVGKYVDLHDAYKSVAESLHHAGLHHGVALELLWVDSEDLERGRDWDKMESADGIVVPGGFGHRGIEGKIQSARFARVNHKPYLGLCLGLQIMVIELARHALGSDEPNSTEFDPGTQFPVIDLLPEQVDVTDMGGTMRLGAWPCRLLPDTLAHKAYGTDLIHERHRHRFEVNPLFLPRLIEAGHHCCFLAEIARPLRHAGPRGHGHDHRSLILTSDARRPSAQCAEGLFRSSIRRDAVQGLT